MILLCGIGSAVAVEPAGLLRGFERVRLQISTTAAEVTEIHAYVAKTQGQRTQGLMNVHSMQDNEGMLFIYPGTKIISMWMKNTYIPLDMVFADTQGMIVHLHAGAVPHDTSIISSVEKAALVLELNAGRIEALGIKIGDRLNIQPE